MFSAATKSAHGPATAANYIEDVFSTYLYTGDGANRTITNNIDLSGKGGLVWIKNRTSAEYNVEADTARGANKLLFTNVADAEYTASTNFINGFTSSGFTVGTDNMVNGSTANYASWTFREQPKFFDVVTYTGTGANRTISHNLGSVPGMIIVKRTDTTSDWQVYHRSLANTEYLVLNTDAAKATGATRWNSTTPTSSVFSLGTDSTVNASSGTYVAYLFAHDASGFGLSGTDNVISCGSFTTDALGDFSVSNLGYEPQYILTKASTVAEGWLISDVMRGWNQTQERLLYANTSAAESSVDANPSYFLPTATGFKTGTSGVFNPSTTYIYMAIRRPMKVPTDATTVFSPVARTGTGANATVSSGFVTDTVIEGRRTGTTAGSKFGAWNRLRGTGYNITNTTDAEVAAATTIIQANPWDVMNGYKVGTTSVLTNANGSTFINWMFKRATGFHDVVCYTGNATARTINHNLGVVPELMLVKPRSATGPFIIYNQTIGNGEYLRLDTTAASATASFWNNTTPTSTVFSVGTGSNINGNNVTYVNLLFATCAGVSKVGSYTGNGGTQAIACGFTGGARFVLIKRTDATGGWYVYDTARGMTTLTNPYLLMNSTAAEVASLGSVTTTTGGFTVDATILAAINTNAATYIFLAIA